MSAVSLTINYLRKAEIERHGKFGHTLGRIQHISIMSIIYIFYKNCSLKTQNKVPTINCLQGFKRCIKYTASQPHKPIFYPSNYYDVSNVNRLTWSGTQVEYYTTQK